MANPYGISTHSRNADKKPLRQRILVEIREKNTMVNQIWLSRMQVGAAVAVLALAFGNAEARAQGANPAPLSKVTVSDEVAKRTLMKAVINADTARAIVDACVEWQKAQPGNVSIAIFVLSPTGQIVDSHQMAWDAGVIYGYGTWDLARSWPSIKPASIATSKTGASNPRRTPRSGRFWATV